MHEKTHRTERVVRRCVAPLLAVLGVAPPGFVAADEFFGDFAEGSALGRRHSLLRLAVSRLCFERVDTIVALVAVLQRLCARLSERHIEEGCGPHG